MSVPTSIRLDEQGQRTVERLAARWGCPETEAIRRLVKAAAQPEGLEVAERLTWPAVLPVVRRYKVARDARVWMPTMPGVVAGEHVFKAGTVIERNGAQLNFIETLVERGVLLEALPD